MGDVGPGADVRDTGHQSIDVAVDAVEGRHLSGNPCDGKPLLGSGEMEKAMGKQPSMALAHDLAKIGDLADLPKQPNRAWMSGQFANIRAAREGLQGAVVVRFAGLDETRYGRALVEALQQRRDRSEFQPVVAPIQTRQRLKAMRFDRFDD